MEDLGIVSNVVEQGFHIDVMEWVGSPWFKIITSILVPIIVALFPLLFNYFSRIEQGNEDRMEFVFTELLYPIIKLKEKFWSETSISIENIEDTIIAFKELLKKHDMFFSKSYTKRITELNQHMEHYRNIQNKQTKDQKKNKRIEKKKKKIQQYLKEDCKTIFWITDVTINRYRKQLGFLYDGAWKIFYFYLKERAGCKVYFICVWFILLFFLYWSFAGFWFNIFLFILLYISLVSFLFHYAYRLSFDNKYNKLFKDIEKTKDI